MSQPGGSCCFKRAVGMFDEFENAVEFFIWERKKIWSNIHRTSPTSPILNSIQFNIYHIVLRAVEMILPENSLVEIMGSVETEGSQTVNNPFHVPPLVSFIAPTSPLLSAGLLVWFSVNENKLASVKSLPLWCGSTLQKMQSALSSSGPWWMKKYPPPKFTHIPEDD